MTTSWEKRDQVIRDRFPNIDWGNNIIVWTTGEFPEGCGEPVAWICPRGEQRFWTGTGDNIGEWATGQVPNLVRVFDADIRDANAELAARARDIRNAAESSGVWAITTNRTREWQEAAYSHLSQTLEMSAQEMRDRYRNAMESDLLSRTGGVWVVPDDVTESVDHVTGDTAAVSNPCPQFVDWGDGVVCDDPDCCDGGTR